MFAVGDRVKYISGRHNTHESNPLVGSKFECPGTVNYVKDSVLNVRWDNGSSNTYGMIDLIYADGDVFNPNFIFRAKKLKKGKV